MVFPAFSLEVRNFEESQKAAKAEARI